MNSRAIETLAWWIECRELFREHASPVTLFLARPLDSYTLSSEIDRLCRLFEPASKALEGHVPQNELVYLVHLYCTAQRILKGIDP